jgi:hypothetical protein
MDLNELSAAIALDEAVGRAVELGLSWLVSSYGTDAAEQVQHTTDYVGFCVDMAFVEEVEHPHPDG